MRNHSFARQSCRTARHQLRQDAQFVPQQPHRARRQILAAGLITGEHGPVQKGDVIARLGQKQRRGRTRRAGSNHEDI